jgi:hypothetical protein
LFPVGNLPFLYNVNVLRTTVKKRSYVSIDIKALRATPANCHCQLPLPTAIANLKITNSLPITFFTDYPTLTLLFPEGNCRAIVSPSGVRGSVGQLHTFSSPWGLGLGIWGLGLGIWGLGFGTYPFK